jgi:hypothetical protein
VTQRHNHHPHSQQGHNLRNKRCNRRLWAPAKVSICSVADAPLVGTPAAPLAAGESGAGSAPTPGSPASLAATLLNMCSTWWPVAADTVNLHAQRRGEHNAMGRARLQQRVSTLACLHACMHACVRACVHACVRACMRASLLPR